MSDGIFGLTSPRDLLDKLMYDFKRLKADEDQQAMLYTAFDFFSDRILSGRLGEGT